MLIVLNGPPGCGKDTLAKLLNERMGLKVLSFKKPMWDIAGALLGDKQFQLFMELYHDRLTKEQPQTYLGGFSPRQFFIHISERVAKPIFGEQYFGERLLRDYEAALDEGHFSVVSDGGFPMELYPFCNQGDPVVVIRLYRDGFTFEGDSRNYLEPSQFESLPAHLRPEFESVTLVDGQVEQGLDSVIMKLAKYF